jgi:hypothetical protein
MTKEAAGPARAAAETAKGRARERHVSTHIVTKEWRWATGSNRCRSDHLPPRT